jgi:hypothetical protein
MFLKYLETIDEYTHVYTVGLLELNLCCLTGHNL